MSYEIIIFVLYFNNLKLQTRPTSATGYIKTFFSTEKKDFNIILFVLLYLALLYGFYLYIGIVSPGGKFYAAFLSRYANFPEWLTVLIAKASKGILQLAGYTVFQRKPSNLTLVGGGGVNIAWACLGAGAMSLWTAFVTAHRGLIQYKLKWIVAGIVLICLVNIARVITILLSLHYKWQYPRHFDAHQTFNILSYAVIVAFMYLFVRNYNGKKALKVEKSI